MDEAGSRGDIPGRGSNLHKGPEALSPVDYFREPHIEVFLLEVTCRSASISPSCGFSPLNSGGEGQENGGLNEKVLEEAVTGEHVQGSRRLPGCCSNWHLRTQI